MTREQMNTGHHEKYKNSDNQRCILVVDDEPLNVKLFTLTLNRRGYRVLQAADGYHGFVLAHDRQPDLIVMDIQLPGLSGLEVTRALKESIHTTNIPVVVVTAFLIDEEELRHSKCDSYMTKPFIIPNFIELIDSLIERNSNRARDGLAAVVS